MNIYTYEKICQEMKAGGTRKVANEDTKVMGEITLCNHGYFNVHVGHGEEVWHSEKCREIAPGEEWKYHTEHGVSE